MFRATRYTYNLTGSQATLLKKIIGDASISREELPFFTHILNNPLVSYYIGNQSNPFEWFQTHGSALKELTMNSKLSMSDALIAFNGLTKAEIDTLAAPTLWARGLRPHHFKQGFKPEHAPVWIKIATEAEKDKNAVTIEKFLDEIKGLSLFDTVMLGELWEHGVRSRHFVRELQPEDAPIIREIVKSERYKTYVGIEISNFLEKSKTLTSSMRDSLVKYWKYGLRIGHFYHGLCHYDPCCHDSAFEVVKHSRSIDQFLSDVADLNEAGIWLYAACYSYRGWEDKYIRSEEWNRVGNQLKQHAPDLIRKLLKDPQAKFTVNQAIEHVDGMNPEQLQLFSRYYIHGLKRAHVVRMGHEVEEYIKLFSEFLRILSNSYKYDLVKELKNSELFDFILGIKESYKELLPAPGADPYGNNARLINEYLYVFNRLLFAPCEQSKENRVRFCISQLQDLDRDEACFLADYFVKRQLRKEHVLALREFERTPLIKLAFGKTVHYECGHLSDVRSIAFMKMFLKSDMMPDVAMSTVKKWDLIALFDYLKTQEVQPIDAENTAAKAAPTVSNQGFFASAAGSSHEREVVQFNRENSCRQ